MLKASNLIKKFDGETILNKVSLEVNKGDVLVILGRSGSGKSTLLRCLNNIEQIDGGSIEIAGEYLVQEVDGVIKYAESKKLKNLCMKMGYVFQNFNLFPHVNVLENLCLAQKLVFGKSAEDAEKTAVQLLKKVGLEGKEKSYPYQLSGGQQQRVAIARALCLEPEILCFDEPTSALDPELTREVLKVIKKLSDENRTMIIVTHEIAFAKQIATKVIYMKDGLIAESGNVEDILGIDTSDEIRHFVGE